MVQRGHYYAIVDEVDSILVDEARTPLIIRARSTTVRTSTTRSTPSFRCCRKVTMKSTRSSARQLLGSRHGKARKLLRQAGLLKAKAFMTSRMSQSSPHQQRAEGPQALQPRQGLHRPQRRNRHHRRIHRPHDAGRRYSEGQHQALEAKEKVQIPRNQTLASITFQNYFRMYDKLAGMTGTASTEAEEFADIYNLSVIEVPTNLPIKRIDEDDEVYRTAEESIRRSSPRSKPRTRRASPSSSARPRSKSRIARRTPAPRRLRQVRGSERPLPRAGSLHRCAGRCTRCRDDRHHMAGRGTDIKLGGNVEMRIEQELGEMPEALSARRPSRPSRPKSGPEGKGARCRRSLRSGHRTPRKPPHRQPAARPFRPSGRPRRSKFYLSLQDDLMRIFVRATRHASEARPQGREAIVHPWITRRWKRARRRSKPATSTSARIF